MSNITSNVVGRFLPPAVLEHDIEVKMKKNVTEIGLDQTTMYEFKRGSLYTSLKVIRSYHFE